MQNMRIAYRTKKSESMYKHFLKRVIDIVLSFLGIIVLSVPMLIVAIAIKCDSKGPVFFRQKRVGIKKKTFTILKFRTMRIDTPHDAPTHELSDPKKWITKVGGFLRKTSLDEIPQIFNIFVGHMSIIGERGIIETTKNNADFSRVVTVNSISL